MKLKAVNAEGDSMTDRPRIPQKTVDNLMFANDHTCCICRTKGKHVQIHHIDGDSSNNTLENLAVLCLECHSTVTGDEGLGRRYTTGEIKQYKRTWEFMARERLVGKEARPMPTKEGISYFDLTVCEILAMDDGDPRIGEKLGTLHQLSIIVGCTDEILDSLFHLAVQSSMSQKQTAAMLANLIYELFFHFVGPDMVSLGSDDESRLQRGVELLGTIGHFNGEFSKDMEVIQAVCDNLYKMCEIAVWYDLEKIGALVISKLQKTKESCLIAYENIEKPLAVGAEYAEQTTKRIRELTRKRSIDWPSVAD